MAISNLVLALLVPFVLILIIASIIIGIGELLLSVGKEAAVPLALVIAALVLLGASIAARTSPKVSSDH